MPRDAVMGPGQVQGHDTYHVLPWDGPAPGPSKTGSRVRLGPAWDSQAGRTCQPRCGLRRRTHAKGGSGMRFYTTNGHRFYCGVDLHARTMCSPL
jgi:hypothetical protein